MQDPESSSQSWTLSNGNAMSHYRRPQRDWFEDDEEYEAMLEAWDDAECDYADSKYDRDND